MEDEVEQRILQRIWGCFTSEIFSLLMLDSGITHKSLQALKSLDEFQIFKNVTSKNVIQEFKKFKDDAFRDGLGWQRTDGVTYGVQVNHVTTWITYMILLHERRTASILEGVVFFKLAIDSRCHWNRGGQVCEVLLELLHDRGLLHCISIAKYESKDSDGEVIAHVGNRQAFPEGGHIFDQLSNIMRDGIIVDGRHLEVRLFECHDLACSYALVSCGAASALGTSFCPWCMVTKLGSIHVTTEIPICPLDTLQSVGHQWHMSASLIHELNPWIPHDYLFDAPLWPHILTFPDQRTMYLTVVKNWPMDRENNEKITPPHMSDLVYCTRHASIRTIRKLFSHLERFAQDLDATVPVHERPSRFDRLRRILQTTPIAIQVTVEEESKGGVRYRSLKFDQSDGIIADRILLHKDLLLQVISDTPSVDRFRHITMMWEAYRHFNTLQQAYEATNNCITSQVEDSLPYMAKEFAWHASRLFETFTPYFHVQTAHAGQMSMALPMGLTLGRLKNEVVERKHREAKNLHTAQGAGRGGPSVEIRGTAEWDRMDLQKEMLSQYMHVRMAYDDLLKKKRKKKWVPKHIRTMMRTMFEENNREDITLARALELVAPYGGVVTPEQIYQLWHNWYNLSRRQLPAEQSRSGGPLQTLDSNILPRTRELTQIAIEVEEARLGFRRIAKRPLTLSEEHRVHDGVDIVEAHHGECSSLYGNNGERALRGGRGRRHSRGTRRGSRRASSSTGFTVPRDD